jgi:hypothetical protein
MLTHKWPLHPWSRPKLEDWRRVLSENIGAQAALSLILFMVLENAFIDVARSFRAWWRYEYSIFSGRGGY